MFTGAVARSYNFNDGNENPKDVISQYFYDKIIYKNNSFNLNDNVDIQELL